MSSTVTIFSTRTAMFPSRREEWRTARRFIEAFCEEAGIPNDVHLKCRLVVEELFMNTVKHGHKGGSDAPIWITLSAMDDQVTLIYEDRAPPFNPFPGDRAAIVRKIEEDRTEGGLGVITTHNLSDCAQYTYLFGRNRIQLTIGR